MLKKSHIAAALEVDPANITRWAKRGMPLYSIDAARQWRRQNIRPRITPAAARAPAGVRYSMPEVAEWIAWTLEQAGAEIVALLHVECALPLQYGDLAVSCVATALSAALEADLPDNDIALVAGPTSPARDPEDIAAARQRIEARVAELRATQPKETP